MLVHHALTNSKHSSSFLVLLADSLSFLGDRSCCLPLLDFTRLLLYDFLPYVRGLFGFTSCAEYCLMSNLPQPNVVSSCDNSLIDSKPLILCCQSSGFFRMYMITME